RNDRESSRSAGTKMPRFISPQLCTAVSRAPQGENWVHEIKFDGYRIQLRVEGRKASMYTRNGLHWTEKFNAIPIATQHLPDAIIGGEVGALDDEGNPSFSALQAALSEGDSQRLIYFAFDLLFAEGTDFRSLPLSERKSRLKNLLGTVHDASIRYVERLSDAG